MRTTLYVVLLSFMLSIGLCGCSNAEEDASPGAIINSTDQFSVIAEQIGEVEAIGDCMIMQGGCAAGDYAYFAMRDREKDLFSSTFILKYDLQTMEKIGQSEMLNLGHANDITYVPDTNELYIIHGGINITVMDPDTLTVKDSKMLTRIEGWSIEYNPGQERYVMGTANGGLVFYDKELELLGAKSGVDTTLATQGICADEKYIYYLFYSEKKNTVEPDNMLFVYDWDGNFITKITLGIEYEPENISLIGDTFYIGCNNSSWSGGLLFTAKIVKEE